jgi:heme exporter protein A
MVTAVGLRKRFASTLVLEGLNLAVAAGECIVLLGPNGAGKTTLLRILATVLRPTAGSLHVDGVDALRAPETARALIGMVGHGSYLYEDLTAFENLRFWATFMGQDASAGRLRAALAEVELDPVTDERVRTFSAGMKRRLALARVLLGRPRVLLLDEPFSGLDRQGRKWLRELLQGLRGDGVAIVLATHNLGGGLELASRIAVLAGGRLAVDRPASELTGDDLRSLYDSLTEGAEEAPT